MTWGQFEELAPEHPKVIKAGPLAAWLWVCSIGYSTRHLTDGHIPHEVVPVLASFRGIGTRTYMDKLGDRWSPVDPYALAETLVDVGLWERTDDGFEIHDFADHNMTRARAESARRGGKRRAALADEHDGRDDNGRFTSLQVSPSVHQTSPSGSPAEVEVERELDSSLDERTEATPERAREIAESMSGAVGDTAAYLLGKLSTRRSWALLLTDPVERRQLEQLGGTYRSGLVEALQQASDGPDKVRKPGAWLRSTVYAIHHDDLDSAVR